MLNDELYGELKADIKKEFDDRLDEISKTDNLYQHILVQKGYNNKNHDSIKQFQDSCETMTVIAKEYREKGFKTNVLRSPGALVFIILLKSNNMSTPDKINGIPNKFLIDDPDFKLVKG